MLCTTLYFFQRTMFLNFVEFVTYFFRKYLNLDKLSCLNYNVETMDLTNLTFANVKR